MSSHEGSKSSFVVGYHVKSGDSVSNSVLAWDSMSIRTPTNSVDMGFCVNESSPDLTWDPMPDCCKIIPTTVQNHRLTWDPMSNPFDMEPMSKMSIFDMELHVKFDVFFASVLTRNAMSI